MHSSLSSPADAPPDPFLLAADLLDPPVDPYADDPVAWAQEVLGIHLWSRQREIAESVRDNSRTAVRSGHGVGKTLTAAVIVLWFLDTHADSRVITTATKWSQVKALLWHEINQLHARAKNRPQAAGRPIFRTAPLQTELHLPDGRYAIGLSSKAENSESFAGHHATNILVVYDEASGIHKSIFEVGEGYMTTPGARALLIGNPTRTSGELFDAFHTKRAEYATLHISARESPAVTGEPVPEAARAALTGPEWIASRERAWGADSPIFAVRVEGNFAKTTTTTVIDLGLVEDAQARHLPPNPSQDFVVIGCDVARFGADETVITERVGQRIRIVETYVGKPTTHTAARVAHWMDQHPAPVTRAVVDDSGVGGGVTDQLRADGRPVTGYNAGHQAHNPLKYPNRRSELWFQLAAQLEDLDLDKDDQLTADLTAPEFKYDAKMRRVVEPKEVTKKRLGRSPDRADGVMLTLVPEAGTGAIVRPPREDDRRRQQYRKPAVLTDDDIMTRPM